MNEDDELLTYETARITARAARKLALNECAVLCEQLAEEAPKHMAAIWLRIAAHRMRKLAEGGT